MTEPIAELTQAELMAALQVPVTIPTATPAPIPTAPIPTAPTASVDETADKVIRKLRDEAAANRVKATEAQAAKEAADAEWATRLEQVTVEATARAKQEFADNFSKAFGTAPDATPTEPADVLAQVEAQKAAAEVAVAAEAAKARQSAVALTVLRRAGTHGVADGDALLDSSAFMSALDGMDPNGAEFGTVVDAQITAALEANPSRFLRQQPGLVAVTPRSGGDMSGGNGDTGSDGPITVESQLKAIQNKGSSFPAHRPIGQSTPLPPGFGQTG